MLTRRGFASCAICAITGFIATDASAQGAPAATAGVSRKVLSQMDGPAPGYMTLVVAIEIISFLSRPLSHSVRLFANMLAGHITLKVFGGFVALLGTSLGAIGWIGGVVPLAMTVALTALELLVAFLQAYVFAILTCIYLNDALHPGH